MRVSDFKWTTCTWAKPAQDGPALGIMNFDELSEDPASSDCYLRDVTLQRLPTASNVRRAEVTREATLRWCYRHKQPELTSCCRRFDGVMPQGRSVKGRSFSQCALSLTCTLSLSDAELLGEVSV